MLAPISAILYAYFVLKKTSFLLPVGVVSILFGASLGYVYFSFLIHTGFLGVLLLIAAIGLVCTGFYFLNRGLASLEGFEKLNPVQDLLGVDVDSNGQPLQSTLEKNKEMLTDWTQTNKTRDELKLLEVQASAQSQKQ